MDPQNTPKSRKSLISINDVGDIEVQLPPTVGASASTAPTVFKAVTDRIKAWSGLITSVVALVTSVFSFLRPTDHTVNKASYELLAADVKKLSEQSAQSHDDMISLRGYVEGSIIRNSAPTIISSAPQTVSSAPQRAKPKVTAQKLPKPAPDVSAVIMAPPPPEVGPKPAPINPPSFDSFLQK